MVYGLQEFLINKLIRTYQIQEQIRMEATHHHTTSETIKAGLIFSIAVLCLLREFANAWMQKWRYILNSSNW